MDPSNAVIVLIILLLVVYTARYMERPRVHEAQFSLVLFVIALLIALIFAFQITASWLSAVLVIIYSVWSGVFLVRYIKSKE